MSELTNVLIHDYETTGVDVFSDRPVQIGVADGTGRILMSTLCDPCMPIAAEAEQVHGIGAGKLVGFPDYLAALYAEYRLFTGYENPILAGFNTSMFDDPMMEACLGFRLPFRKLDLLDVIYRYYPSMEQKKLTQLYQQFTGEELAGAHGAIQDCVGTAVVLRHVCEEHKKSVEELVDELSRPKVYSVMPIGKHRGKPIGEVDKGWAQWMLRNADRMRPDLQLSVEWIAGGTR